MSRCSGATPAASQHDEDNSRPVRAKSGTVEFSGRASTAVHLRNRAQRLAPVLEADGCFPTSRFTKIS